MLNVGLSDYAGRAAYMAGFHAAQALIFKHVDRIYKTHKGVQAEFLRLTRNDPRFAPHLRGFLSRAYDLKAIADYETGSGSRIPYEEAAAALETAKEFLACIEKYLREK